MRSKAEVFAHVSATMVELFELDAADVTLEARLIEDLDLDSIDAIDLAARLQQLTGRRVPEDALRSLRTVADVVDLVHTQLLGAEPEAASAKRPA